MDASSHSDARFRPMLVAAWKRSRRKVLAGMGLFGLIVLVMFGESWLEKKETPTLPQDPKLDATDTQLALKGQYLYQFAKGNDWPETSKSGPFIVAIHGKPELVEEMASKYASHPIGQQALTIQKLDDPLDMAQPQIVYTESTGVELESLLEVTMGRPILVVTALQPELAEGVGINLFTSSNQLRYEINLQAAEDRGILVGNRILSWAVER